MVFVLRESIVMSLQGKQFLMRSTFHDDAMMKNTDQISVLDGRETMSNDDRCSIQLRSIQGFLDETFTLTIQGTRC